MVLKGKPYTIENGAEDARLFSDLKPDMQEEAMHYVKDSIIMGKHVYHKASSYGLKHYIQGATNIYMTNNQFKDLMLICGFRTDDVNELNWHFNVDKKSPLFKPHYYYEAHNPKFYKESQYPMG